jgi:hypothetical protein
LFNRAADYLSLRHPHTLRRLQSKKVPFTEKTYSGQWHLLNEEAWSDAIDFVAKALPKPGV